ncbi:VanZ family protein [Microbacterium sp. KUDC0406]|uniref:VanZ family protein n=1 Tax=Microbacterium sp. KUDC0406 TaxID=2909588 RepID=UPI001F2AA76C|nr:VanZ family protein [Microbacterium sp. KUDC0406]UJP08878.1 VanZ family protein [Microbacterium sp. KUDC0406]
MEIFVHKRIWVRWALAAYLVAVGLIVLLPVSYSEIIAAIWNGIRTDLGLTFFGAGWVEFTANVLMFLPLGFLLTLLFRHPWYGTLLALVLSAGVEVAQIVIPDRVASLRDIVANTLGAAIGAFLAWLLFLRRDHKRSRAAARAAASTR